MEPTSGSEDLSLLLMPADVLVYLIHYLNLKHFSSLASTSKRADEVLWAHRREIPPPGTTISPYSAEFTQRNYEFFSSLLLAAKRGKLRQITKLSSAVFSDENLLDPWSGVLKSMPNLQDISIQVTNPGLKQVLRDTLTANPAITEHLVALRIQAPDVPSEMPKLIGRIQNLRVFQLQTTHERHGDDLVRATIAALPATVEELVVNVMLDHTNGLKHLPRLARLWMKSNPEYIPLLYRPHPYDFMAVENDDPAVRLAWQADLSNWKSLLKQLEAKIPGKMAMKTLFYTSIENESDWQDDPVELDESLLHMFVTLEDPVPTLKFALDYLGKEEFIDSIMAKYEWAPRQGYRSEQIESVFEYSMKYPIAAKYLIETIQPDVIQTGLLPMMIKRSKNSPELLEYIVGPLLDESLKRNHFRRDQLSTLFFSSIHGQGSIIFMIDTWEWKELLTPQNISRLAIDINVRSADENRPLLHFVLRTQSLSAISLLVDMGADILAADEEGNVALDLALSLPHLEIIYYFIKLYKDRGLKLPDRTELAEETRLRLAALLLEGFMNLSDETAAVETNIGALLEMVYLDDLLAIVSNKAMYSGYAVTQAMLSIVDNHIKGKRRLPFSNLGHIDTHIRRIVAGLKGSGKMAFSEIDHFRARMEACLVNDDDCVTTPPSSEENIGWSWA